MPFYDSIARQWHAATGHRGGAFKAEVLNDLLIERMAGIDGRALLELGAGNGYFLPMALKRYSGQVPARIVVTDQSARLLGIAEARFRLPDAEYRQLDVRRRFPFEDDVFDLILATMVFNEVGTPGLRRALAECRRVLGEDGLLLVTVLHPAFVESLSGRGQLRKVRGRWAMPGAGGLRVPVVRRSVEDYETLLREAGFACEREDVFPNRAVLNAKPGLRKAGRVPIGLVMACRPAGT